jgi:hypothetical protein
MDKCPAYATDSELSACLMRPMQPPVSECN